MPNWPRPSSWLNVYEDRTSWGSLGGGGGGGWDDVDVDVDVAVGGGVLGPVVG